MSVEKVFVSRFFLIHKIIIGDISIDVKSDEPGPHICVYVFTKLQSVATCSVQTRFTLCLLALIHILLHILQTKLLTLLILDHSISCSTDKADIQLQYTIKHTHYKL